MTKKYTTSNDRNSSIVKMPVNPVGQAKKSKSELEQIQAILFGAKTEELDNQIEGIKSDFNSQLESLKSEFDSEIRQLTVRIKTDQESERKQRTLEKNAIEKTIASESSKMSEKLLELREQQAVQKKHVEEQVQAMSADFNEKLHKTKTDLEQLINRSNDRLDSSKLEKAALAKMLKSMSDQLVS